MNNGFSLERRPTNDWINTVDLREGEIDLNALLSSHFS